MTIQRRYKTMAEAMSLTQLQAEMTHDDWRVPIARKEFVERLVAIRIDALLGHDEPGWHSISPMYGAIEFQGDVPQGVRQARGERVSVAAERLRSETKGDKLARELIDRLPPRQRVALLVDGLRKRYRLTQIEACSADRWSHLVGRLQLSRWLTPAQLKPMKHKRLRDLLPEAYRELRSSGKEQLSTT